MRIASSLILCLALVSCTRPAPTISEAHRLTTGTDLALKPEASGRRSPYLETIPGTDVSFRMVFLPQGTYRIGSPEGEAGRDEDEGPQRTVRVEPFWMGAHEVTYDEYAIFRYRNRDTEATAALGARFDVDAVTRPTPPYEDPARGMGNQGYPAVSMTQQAALHYARWLSQKTGHFYRLPTEAEWEYACRAGTTTAYSFGHDPAALDVYSWFGANSGGVFHQVGQKKPNPWGLFDMHGNVSEWTLDQYEAAHYASLPADVPSPSWARPTKRHPRTVRGGSYNDDPEDLRCAARLQSSLTWKRRDPQLPQSVWWNTDSPFVGFRLVRPANPPTPEAIQAFWLDLLGE